MSQLKHLSRVALLVLPLLLLLGLNGRTVTLLRPAAPVGSSQASAAPRATVIKQRVTLEAAAPLASYVAPAALAWLPGTLHVAGRPRLVRWAGTAAPLGSLTAFVAQRCRQRLLSAALLAQAP